MMQQFATQSSKLAVSSLPVNMDNRSSSAASDERTVFSEGKSAFEKAIINAENGAFRQNKRNESAASDLRSPVLEQDDSAKLIGVGTRDGKSTQPVERPSKPGLIAEQTDKQLDSQASKVESPDNAVQSNVTSEINEAETPAAELLNANSQQSDSDNGAGEDFDYVNFVSQIQQLNEEVVDTVTSLTEGIENDEKTLDLANVSLSQQELQAVLDAQQAGVDLNDALSQEQLDKLDAAITSMLTQYQQQSAQLQDDRLSENTETAALDKALMQTMIQQSASELKDVSGEALNAALASEGELAKQVAVASEAELAKQAALKADMKLDAQDALTMKADKATIQTELAEAQVAQNKQSNSINVSGELIKDGTGSGVQESLATAVADGQGNTSQLDATTIAPSASALGADAQMQIKVNNDDSKALVNQLAMLDERSQTNTIENIKSRVEKFTADLSNATKGNEFVAAMQSGLKEFKEQLQSGREPGIDLKALVSEALAQANVEIPAQNQPKLDNALTQFGAVMSLANSLNQSAQAQAHQLFGMNETQIIKESNALHTEGTKLAQQAPSNFDKAVNIFKPEGQQQLAEKVRWMVAGRNPAAEIRLDPPELGAMQIKVNMSSDAATVSFTVQSSQAKEALDQQLPKLREMLQEQGIELGQSSVQQDSKGQASQQDEQMASHSNNTDGMGSNEVAQEDMPVGVIEQRITGGSLGGIDYYA
ncbi:flagellar hook-length control protein FliK [Glaciecola sp. XM2]|uniref:flagellar hook-length control protein FliK n=1 Tax=Glaciecola sp. XM2 TaxID=1914931 RepID=UPI001BDE8844|nr:flagellar hook-length control protein FliK [Glaciecola sp. XM2]MBT1450825.1 flagellar hook-length control protein FliK [Glaciecola sp. XM2]